MMKPHEKPEPDPLKELVLLAEGVALLASIILACVAAGNTGDPKPLIVASVVTFVWAMFRVP